MSFKEALFDALFCSPAGGVEQFIVLDAHAPINTKVQVLVKMKARQMFQLLKHVCDTYGFQPADILTLDQVLLNSNEPRMSYLRLTKPEIHVSV